MVAARGLLVGIVGKDSVSSAGDRGHKKTSGDARNGAVMDVGPTQHRVETVVENRGETNDAERVDIGNDIVGHTVRLEHGGKEAGGGTESVVVDILDGKEAEDTGGLKCSAHVVNELVVPLCVVDAIEARGLDVGGLRSLPETVTADTPDPTPTDADAENAEHVGKVAASGGGAEPGA